MLDGTEEMSRWPGLRSMTLLSSTTAMRSQRGMMNPIWPASARTSTALRSRLRLPFGIKSQDEDRRNWRVDDFMRMAGDPAAGVTENEMVS